MDPLSEELHRRVLDLLAAGQKIEAIKAVREGTGLGLAEAKGLVEHLAANAPPATPRTDEAALDPAAFEEVRRSLAAGRKIDAIKRYREATGLGLADAKAAVEALERSLPPPAPGVVETSRGCAGVLALVVVGLALALLVP